MIPGEHARAPCRRRGRRRHGQPFTSGGGPDGRRHLRRPAWPRRRPGLQRRLLAAREHVKADRRLSRPRRPRHRVRQRGQALPGWRDARRRRGAHVLLLHANALNADRFGDLALVMKKRGYRFVTLRRGLARRRLPPSRYLRRGMGYLLAASLGPDGGQEALTRARPAGVGDEGVRRAGPLSARSAARLVEGDELPRGSVPRW
jgi:hypothetical protein